MSKENAVIFVPGLDDAHGRVEGQTEHFRKHGFSPSVYALWWRDGEGFIPKLSRFVNYIDRVKRDSDTVSLVGVSAGGSAVLDAYFERSEIINAVVCVSSKLREGLGPLRYGLFGVLTARSAALPQAIKLFQHQRRSLINEDLEKIMTIHGRFDQLVPASLSQVEGAANIDLGTIGHENTIRTALTSEKPLIPFIKSRL